MIFLILVKRPIKRSLFCYTKGSLQRVSVCEKPEVRKTYSIESHIHDICNGVSVCVKAKLLKELFLHIRNKMKSRYGNSVPVRRQAAIRERDKRKQR